MPEQLLLNGVIAGSIYSLVALGFSLIYQTTRFFHFAYGAFICLAPCNLAGGGESVGCLSYTKVYDDFADGSDLTQIADYADWADYSDYTD
jgi:hypothetical protein